MGRVTIKQIAEQAGVSVSAVSYVLNGKKGVSEETRQRILEIIAQLQYTPNLNSRRLILRRSFNLLLWLGPTGSTLENLFYTEMLGAIVSRGSELGYHIVLSNDSEEALLQDLSQHNADGVLFLKDISRSLQDSLREAEMPYVVIDSHRPDAPYARVISDMEQMARLAVEHLIDAGHRRIAFLGSDAPPDFFVRSETGYRRTMEAHGLPVDADWIRSEARDEETAKRCARQLMACPARPTALFCAGDLYALAAMDALREMGLRVPEDVSLVGVDDIILARYCRPALTTVHVDKRNMAFLGVDLLHHLIEGESPELLREVPVNQLIRRETVLEQK